MKAVPPTYAQSIRFSNPAEYSLSFSSSWIRVPRNNGRAREHGHRLHGTGRKGRPLKPAKGRQGSGSETCSRIIQREADYSIDGTDAGHQADFHDRDPQLMGRSGTSPVTQELDADKHVTLLQLPHTQWEGTRPSRNRFDGNACKVSTFPEGNEIFGSKRRGGRTSRLSSSTPSRS